MCVLLITRLLRLVGRLGSRKPVNHTSWVAIATPADRPKSVRNRCVIEVFGGVLCVVTLLFGFFCQCEGFCHRAESDLFLSLCMYFYWFPICFNQSCSVMHLQHICWKNLCILWWFAQKGQGHSKFYQLQCLFLWKTQSHNISDYTLQAGLEFGSTRARILSDVHDCFHLNTHGSGHLYMPPLEWHFDAWSYIYLNQTFTTAWAWHNTIRRCSHIWVLLINKEATIFNL